MLYAYKGDGRWVIASLMPRFKGIGAWHTLSDAERAKHGWYPCVEVNAQFDPATQLRSPPAFALSDGSVTATYTIWDKPQSQIKAEADHQTRDQIRAEYDETIAELEAMYYVKERETWPQQVAEAKAYAADNTADTPLIDAMLEVRVGDTKSGLVTKIITKYTAYCQVVGQALATMQTKLAAM